MLLRAFTQHQQSVEIGATYRRTGAGAIIETAQVLDTGTDKLGIPHVRFCLQVGSVSAKTTVEARTLSLEAFVTRYKEKIVVNQQIESNPA